MRVGVVIEETWDFFSEIYHDLVKHYETTLFKRRIFHLPIFNTRVNRYRFQRDLNSFMRGNDVVFFEWASDLLAAATHLEKSSGIVTRLHRYEMYKWIDKVNWDAVDKVILVSRAKQREFIAKFPTQAPKTVVINEAIRADKFVPTDKAFSGDIGILCHLTPRKRVYDLIIVFSELVNERDGFHLHIGGGPHQAHLDYYSALRNLVERLKLQDKVSFYGRVSEPWNWYHQIDIFISNSYSEGLQVAPIEAMASGCYCLSHRWDGSEELLPEENLFDTHQELKDRIFEYCGHTEKEKLHKKARMRQIAREKFDVEDAQKKIREIIEQVAIEGRL